MPAMILRVLTLLALALMPFGMSAAMAGPVGLAPTSTSAMPCAEHHSRPAGNTAGHAVDCAMGCSMLIAEQARISDPAPAVSLPTVRPLAERSVGLQPETATPPPKLS
ncbi:MAG: hypothetical protein ABIO69_05925 [Sphingomicrobium sp.]